MNKPVNIEIKGFAVPVADQLNTESRRCQYGGKSWCMLHKALCYKHMTILHKAL